MAETSSMTFVGDIYVKREDAKSIFQHVGSALASDLLFGNLEAPVTDSDEPLKGKPLAGVNFRSPVSTAQALADVGFRAVGVANNHSLDYGWGGLAQTLSLLDDAGVAHCGGGTTLQEALVPAVVEVDGKRVAFLSVSSVFVPGMFPATGDSPGIATVRVQTAYVPSVRVFEQPGSPATTVTTPDPESLQTLLDRIAAVKAEADVVVVSWHWGVSQSYRELVDYQVTAGHAAIDAGADLVVGHHPHVLQGIEFYGDGAILYSLGNFAFDYHSPHFDRESAIAHVELGTGPVSSVRITPVSINDACEPEAVEVPGRGDGVLALLRQASERFGTDLAVEAGQIVARPAG